MLMYRIITNPLTQDVMDTEQVVAELGIRYPSVGESNISTVIDGLAKLVEEKLVEGKSINLADFVRFFPSLPGRLDTPDESVFASSLRINSAVSSPMVNRIQEGVSLSRQPYQERSPSVSSVVESGGRSNYLGSLLSIKGDGLDADTTSTSQGVFLVNTHSGTSSRVTSYASATNGGIVCLNDVVTAAATDQYAEYDLQCKVRYTSNGSLRTGVYSVPLRVFRAIHDDEDVFDNDKMFYSYYDGSNVDGATASAVTYDNSTGGVWNFSIRIRTLLSGEIRPDSQLVILVTDINDANTEYEFLVPCYSGGSIITSYAMTAMSLLNVAGDDNITDFTIGFSDLALLWNVVNFRYYGEMIEYVQWTYTPPAP
jgi:hypothetical protein